MTATVTPGYRSSLVEGLEGGSALTHGYQNGGSGVGDLRDAEWDDSIRSHSQATIFHTSEWARVLTQTYGHRFVPFCLSDHGLPVAMLPMMEIASLFTGRRGVGMPFSDFCEPLISNGFEPETLVPSLTERARERSWRYFELRGGRAILPATAVPAEQYYGHRLDLTPGVDQIFSKLGSPVRRAIRKAQTSGLRVEVGNTMQAVKDFYRLHVRTRRRHGAPPQPFSFFNHIQKEILEPNLGFIVTAKRGVSAIASAVFFGFDRSGIFKFGASDPRHQELRANNLVMWEGIQRLVQLGAESLHFGRTDLSNDGLRRFKLAWGPKEEMIEYFKFDVASGAWMTRRHSGSSVYNQVFRSLPLAANRIVGAWVYPHLD